MLAILRSCQHVVFGPVPIVLNVCGSKISVRRRTDGIPFPERSIPVRKSSIGVLFPQLLAAVPNQMLSAALKGIGPH